MQTICIVRRGPSNHHHNRQTGKVTRKWGWRQCQCTGMTPIAGLTIIGKLRSVDLSQVTDASSGEVFASRLPPCSNLKDKHGSAFVLAQ